MKFFIILSTLAILTLCVESAAVGEDSNLAADFDEFVKLLPKTKIVNLAFNYFVRDEEIKEFTRYLKGSEFATVWTQFTYFDEFVKVVKYLENYGIDAASAFSKFADFFGLAHLPNFGKSFKAGQNETGGVQGLYEDILNLLPLARLNELFKTKLENSEEFKAFIEFLVQEVDLDKLKEFFNSSEEAKAFYERLTGYGVTMDELLQHLKEQLGYEQKL